MAVIGWLSLVVAVIGAVIYLALTEPKKTAAAQLALYAWAAGLLAFLLANAGRMVRLG